MKPDPKTSRAPPGIPARHAGPGGASARRAGFGPDHEARTGRLERSAVSRYIQLATLFRRRIDYGGWPVGSQIPTIAELSLEFAVAPATIRQALGLLGDEGLVAPFRGKGTFVAQRPRDRIWCEVETDWSGLLRAREGANIEVLSREIVSTAPVPTDRQGALASSYLHLRRRHSRAGVVFLVADVYLDARLSRLVPQEAYATETAMSLVASIPGVCIADARQTLTVGAADIEAADELGVALNAPVAHVHRCMTDDGGKIVMISNGVYRGDAVRLDLKVR